MASISLKGQTGRVVTLALEASRAALTSHAVKAINKVVYADECYQDVVVDLTGLDYDASEAVIIELWQGTGPVKAQQWSLVSAEKRYELHIDYDAQRLFANTFLFAELALKVRYRTDPGNEAVLYVERAHVVIPEGQESENLMQMAEYLSKNYEKYLTHPITPVGGDAFEEDSPKENDWLQRLTLLEEILKTYKLQYAYFKSNGHFRLHAQTQVAGLEKLREVNDRTVAFMISHPEELMQAAHGCGIRVGNGYFVPRHTLVQADQKVFDVPENRILVGFLLHLGTRLKEEGQKLHAFLQNNVSVRVEAGYLVSTEALDTKSTEMLREQSHTMSVLGEELQMVARHYITAFELEGQALPVTQMPAPTPIFLNVPAYRMVYDGMRQWFAMKEMDYGASDYLYSNIGRSRFYEHFCLVKMIEGFRQKGFCVTHSYRFDYAKSQQEKGETAIINTFKMENATRDRQITIYYEPCVYGSWHKPENGVNLIRTTAFSVDGEDQGKLSSVLTDEPYYKPDYLVHVIDEAGCDDWWVIDAKYSERGNAIRRYAIPMTFKYLQTMMPINGRAFKGLWLLCGKPTVNNWAIHTQSRLSDVQRLGQTDVFFESWLGEESEGLSFFKTVV